MPGTTALNHAMLQLDCDDKGINIDGKKLTNLRFAGDIVLISQDREELQQVVEELDDVSKAIGLTMNRSKTMVMRNEWADASPITLEGTTLPFTDSYVYLGRLISMDNNLRAVIMRRRRCVWAALGNIKEAAHLISDKKVRADLSDSTVLPALLRIRDLGVEQDVNANVGSRTKSSRADATEDQPRKAGKSQPPQRRHVLNVRHP
ncbi:hypothetical protein V3C99_012978 [Haemonchus contortus]|nr:endonuclease-reverse transcriptase [Haemonchus contortus]